MTLSDKTYKEIESNRPHPDANDLYVRERPIYNNSREGTTYGAILIAAAINQLSHVLNEQLTELVRIYLEKQEVTTDEKT